VQGLHNIFNVTLRSTALVVYLRKGIEGNFVRDGLVMKSQQEHPQTNTNIFLQ